MKRLARSQTSTARSSIRGVPHAHTIFQPRLTRALPSSSPSSSLFPCPSHTFTTRAQAHSHATTSSSVNMEEASLEEEFWDWKYSSRIRYFRAGTTGPPLLLVHGFGVGAYHYDRNIPELAKQFRVWSIDLLGQGSSWPQADPHPDEKLYYSIDTWTQQLADFIDVHIGEPTYLVGNSLGGYLSVSLAASRPESTAGLILLNATPFWSFRPPLEQQKGGLWSLMPFDGAVPLPENVKRPIERLWWDKLRSPSTIQSMIQMVYTNKAAADDSLIQRIVEATLHPRALDAFASIVMSPKSRQSFDEMLQVAAQRPICLLYGRDDPWVVPLWGQRVKRRIPSATYLEVTPAGHCPHHEAPLPVNQMIQEWVTSVESGQPLGLPLLSSREFQQGGQTITVTHVTGGPRNVFEWLDFLVWNVQGKPQVEGQGTSPAQ